MGESVTTATVAGWLKKAGEAVKVDESLVALDSDKATVEVPCPVSGILESTLVAEGAEVRVGQVIAMVREGAAVSSAPAPAAPVVASAPAAEVLAGPAARRAAQEAGIDTSTVSGTGKGGRVTREDVENASRKPEPAAVPAPVKAAPVAPVILAGDEPEEVVPMTSIRKRIAERLVQAQQSAAILTTFNEVDMSRVMALREKYQDRFVKKYGIKLGFMSFFVKAAVEGLKAFPMANAEIRGESIAYKHYYHIGVAVSGPRGLVVPVVRHADRLSFAETEQAIAAFGEKAKKNQISVDELRGGTFTLSNGGIFGSMMSTPILNSPQVAILGMHAIQKRAVVVNDEIVIRPMMYLAVSYDHRLLDGREAVSFLVRIKECIEDPERLLLEV
jgi:2-oxoglutarate dehydrogenase E2 component (dihydrolipoamide succinyltransferase)